MSKSSLKLISENPHYQLNKNLIKKIGLTETYVLQHLLEFQFNVFGGKEFYQQQTILSKELGIKLTKLKEIISKLNELNLISYTKKGAIAKNYYSVNQEEVNKFILNKDTTPKVKEVVEVKEITTPTEEIKINVSNEVKSVEVIDTTPIDTLVSNNEDMNEYDTFEINTGTIKVINPSKLKFIVESGYQHIIKKIKNTKSEFMANQIIDEEYDKVMERLELFNFSI